VLRGQQPAVLRGQQPAVLRGQQPAVLKKIELLNRQNIGWRYLNNLQ